MYSCWSLHTCDSHLLSRENKGKGWEAAAAQDSHLNLPQYPRYYIATKSLCTSPACGMIATYIQLVQSNLYRVTSAPCEGFATLSFCFFGVYCICSLLICNAGHFSLWENLHLYRGGRGQESMTRTNTFMYGVFYNHLSCCTLWKWPKKTLACFIIYFRAFLKIHVKEIADFTFKTRKILKLQEKQNISLPVLPHSCSI